MRYVQYTDATFTAQVIANRSLGILGPVVGGVLGNLKKRFETGPIDWAAVFERQKAAAASATVTSCRGLPK